MIPFNLIVENRELVEKNNTARNCKVDVGRLLALDEQRKEIISKIERGRKYINDYSKSSNSERSDNSLKQLKDTKREVADFEKELLIIESDRHNLWSFIPNILDPKVPVGTEEALVIVRKVGNPRQFSFAPRPHDEIGEKLNILDIKRGVNAAKARFYCLKNQGVLLRYALINLFLEMTKDQGWELVSPPYLVKDKTLFTSGYLPFADKENFAIKDQDLSLIGTSEQSLLGMHMDETLTDLPKMYLGDSMCFRTEAGSYGKDTKGILRVHQFFKLEQIIFCRPEDGEKYHQLALANEENILKLLEIPYQVVLMNSTDLAAPGAIKYDTEAWMPSQNKYREVTSNTYLTDYQTRRGNIKYRDGEKKGFPHTISATGFCDRLIIAIIENYQNEDGTVSIPTSLQKYMNNAQIIQTKVPGALNL